MWWGISQHDIRVLGKKTEENRENKTGHLRQKRLPYSNYTDQVASIITFDTMHLRCFFVISTPVSTFPNARELQAVDGETSSRSSDATSSSSSPHTHAHITVMNEIFGRHLVEIFFPKAGVVALRLFFAGKSTKQNWAPDRPSIPPFVSFV